MTPEAKVSTGPLLWTNLIIVWIVWGSTYMGIRFATESIPPFIAMGTRFLVAFAIMIVVTGLMRGWSSLRVTRTELATSVFIGVAMLGVGLGTVGLAEFYVPTGVMALIIASTPLTIVIWRVITGDRPPGLTLLGVVIGLAGIGWMLLPGGTSPVSGSDGDVVFWSVMILISATIWATTSFFSARMPTPKDSFTLTTYELLGGGTALLVIGLMIDDDVAVGVVSAPALGRRWWAARGDGAWTTGPESAEPRRIRVSSVARLEDASFSFSDPDGWDRRGLDALMSRAWRTRAYGDFWSHMLVAEGAVDIAAEVGLQLYDVAALIPVVEEAGGSFTSLDGAAPGGSTSLTSNGLLHDQALTALRDSRT